MAIIQIPIAHWRTFNSSNTAGTYDGTLYFSNYRKNRYNIEDLDTLAGISNIYRAYLNITLKGVYNNKIRIWHCCAPSSKGATTVFSTESTAEPTDADCQVPVSTAVFYPAKTLSFDVTELLKYAKKNYASTTWTLWQSFYAGTTTAYQINDPTLYVETDPPPGFNNEITPYVRVTGIGSLVRVPSAAMTANSSQDCVASTNSTYNSSFSAWKAFNYGKDNGWISKAANSTGYYLQLKMPYPLYNITATIINRTNTENEIGGITKATFKGSNDGTNFTDILTITRSTNVSGASTIHELNNAEGYSYIRLAISDYYKRTSGGFVCVGELILEGYKYAATDSRWVEAVPYVYDEDSSSWKATTFGRIYGEGSTPDTSTLYTYPTSGTNLGINNSDYACASTEFVDNESHGYYKAVAALGLTETYGWRSSATATNPWIQVHLPHDAYNLQVTIKNLNGSDSNRPISGPITGRFFYDNRRSMRYSIDGAFYTGVSFTRDGSTASASDTYNIGNIYPIRNIFILVDTWNHTSSNGSCAIGKLEFTYYSATENA